MPTIRELLDQAAREEYLSVELLALLLNVSEDTIVRKVIPQVDGVLRVGRQYRIPRATCFATLRISTTQSSSSTQ